MKQNEILLIVVGLAIGWISLSINQLIPYQFSIASLASLVSPTGAQVSISGLRIKHWLVGVLLGVAGFLSYYTASPKKSMLKQIGLIAIGAGTFLVADEYLDVLRFIITGQYP